jgi:hypothetical protein
MVITLGAIFNLCGAKFRPRGKFKNQSMNTWSQYYDFFILQLQRQRCSRLERF